MNFDHSPALRMVNLTCLQQHLIEFTFCNNDWSLLIVLYWLLFSTSILSSSHWRISIRCFCLRDRLFEYCTTADAVHSEELILELIGVASFGVGKFNIALILGYNGLYPKNETVCLGRAIKQLKIRN